MSDLVTWLRAQLDADERVAREAACAPWTADIPRAVHVDASAIAANPAWRKLGYVATVGWEADRQHIARWDPARALAEIDADRRILDAYESDNNRDLYGGCGDDCEWKALGWIIRVRATVYADREGYRDEWRPAPGHPDE
jgi:hypothetical protein